MPKSNLTTSQNENQVLRIQLAETFLTFTFVRNGDTGEIFPKKIQGKQHNNLQIQQIVKLWEPWLF